jgi:hypothetical protein
MMMQLHQAWRDMTPENRTLWDRFISFSGATINRDNKVLLTGHALFIKYNYLRLISQLSILTDITFAPITSFPVFDSMGTDPVTLDFVVNAAFDGDVIWAVVKLSAVRNPSLSFSPKGLLFMYSTNQGISQESFDCAASYTAAFGALPSVGQTLHWSIQFFSMTAPVIAQKMTGTAILVAV